MGKADSDDGGSGDDLTGGLVSSLHKVKLQDNIGRQQPERITERNTEFGIEHGLFVFGDLNAKFAGYHRLKFTLYEMRRW